MLLIVLDYSPRGGGGGGTGASLHSDTVEDLIRISVGGGGGTGASLHSDTVEDLIRISVGGGGALEHPFIQTQWKI